MTRKIRALALTLLMVLPVTAPVAAEMSDAEMEAKIKEITSNFEKEVAQLRNRMEEQEATIEDINDQTDNWDLASRIQINGDLRTRLDYHRAESATYYPATDVARGVYDFIDTAGMNGLLSSNGPGGSMPLGNFGLTVGSLVGDPSTPGTLLGNLSPALAGGKSAFITAATSAGLTTQQATDAYALFSNPSAAALVVQIGAAGYNVGQLLGAMSSPQSLAAIMKSLPAADRASIFANMYNNYLPRPGAKYENDTLWTSRLRLNMRVKATENVEMKARLVGYKTWGMQDSSMPEVNENGVHDTSSPYFLNSRSFDGTSGRQPVNNLLVIDRAFANWNNIGGLPFWFSIGRRPTTDGPPAHLRMGLDNKMATPVAFMDYPFDGISLGYAYANLFGIDDAPGRIRFCYGRGFESGPNLKDSGINDVDFAGISWDIYKKGNRFFNIQSFGAINLFNVPGDTVFPNPLELAAVNQAGGNAYRDQETGVWYDGKGTLDSNDDMALGNTYLDRINMGNVYHTSGVVMDKIDGLNYFLALGWSRTDPKTTDEMGITLLGDFWNEPEERDGYAVYVGTRYDFPDSPFKIGLEYNYGTKYWLGFTPGHDDIYASKLYTRGSVYEIYTVYDIPGGEPISKFGKAFIRLGYQHFDYEYTYSGMWLGTPTKIDEVANDPLSGQFYAPLDKIDQVYLTFEAYF